jgi:hypothetical protein
VNDPHSVRHVTDEAVAGIEGAAPPNAVPPVDACAGTAQMALSTATTMVVRRFSSVHSPD